MPVVRFLRNFDWKPVPSQTIAYKAGAKHLVTTRCAERAIAKGYAEKIERPAFKKIEEPVVKKASRRPSPKVFAGAKNMGNYGGFIGGGSDGEDA